jgi:peroxidase
LISEAHSRVGSLRLSDWFNRPLILELDNNFDDLAKGLATQPQESTDINFDKEIKHFLFRNGRKLGSDLRSIDIHRNRDHGLASYNDYREFCGLPRAKRWEDYADLIAPQVIANLRSLYESHDDVDLTVGASLESHVDGTQAGPTFLCILTEQFFRTRVGDRFFYEHQHTALTGPQLREIRKSSVARLLCNNVNKIHMIQPEAFKRISVENSLLPCTLLPAINLMAWKDDVGGHGHH